MPALAGRCQRLVAACWVHAALPACSAEPPRPFPFTIQATDDADTPLRGVDVWARGASLGESDARGVIETRAVGHAGDVLRMRARCPAGYTVEETERRWVLADATGPSAAGPSVHVRCHAIEHQAALVVRASTEAGNPLAAVEVHVDGERVGQTDADGSEHILLQRPPGSRVTVALDASAHPQLSAPQHVQSTLIGDADAVVLVERTFALATPRLKPRRRPVPQAHGSDDAARPKPFRIR